MQYWGILKFGQKVKLFHMLQTISMQNLENFWHWEGHRFKFQSLGEWKSLKLWNEVRPTCQSQQPLNRSHQVTGRARVTQHLDHRAYTPHRVDNAAATGRRGRRRPHVSYSLSSCCSSLRSSHNSPLSRTPARSCRGALHLALPCRHTAAPRATTPTTASRAAPRRPPQAPPNLGLLPELLATARSRSQATPRCHCHREAPPHRPAPPATEPPHRCHREHHLCSGLLSEPRASHHHHRTTLSTPFPFGRPLTTMEHVPRRVSPLSTAQNQTPEPSACISAISPTPSHSRSPESAGATIARAPAARAPLPLFSPWATSPARSWAGQFRSKCTVDLHNFKLN
jgi:hypothetical protein